MRYKFELESQSGLKPRQEVTTPMGWDTNKPTLTRDEVYHGVFRTFTVDLTFVKDGYTYLKELYDTEGILCECLVYIYEHNNKTHEFELQDIGRLDFSSYSRYDKNGKGVTITITDTAFAEKIRGRESVVINYNDNTDLDGNSMSEPVYIDQEIFGMEVVSKGLISVKEKSISFKIDDSVPPGSFATPELEYSGQVINGFSVISRYVNSTTGLLDKDTDAFFIAEAEGVLKIDGIFKFNMFVSNSVGLPEESYVELRQAFDNGDPTVTLKAWYSQGNGIYNNIDLDLSGEYNVSKGDYIYLIIKNGIQTAVTNEGTIYIYESEVSLIQKDKALPTVSKGAFIFDCFNRSIESITGVKDTLISQPFGDGGEYHDFTVQNGFLIRNYTPEESGLSFKFKDDLFQNIEKVFNIGLAINSNQTVEIREKKNFFKNGVILTITPDMIEADTFEKTIDTEYYFSDIEVGYTKSAYEEISGLEEYNNQSAYTTIISNLSNKLDALSKIRGDGYGIEFARRKQKADEETEDSKYDSDLFLLNVIQNGQLWQQLSKEGFEDVTGIDDVTTPINLKITPGRNLHRWGWLLAAGLQKYTESIIKFNKADVISDLSTTFNGKTVAENVNIPYSELDSPVFTGHKIIFSAPLSLSNYKILKENPYQLIKVWNPIDKEYNFGWIREVSIESVDTATNWELIEARDVIEFLGSWLNNTGGYWLWNDGGKILLNN